MRGPLGLALAVGLLSWRCSGGGGAVIDPPTCDQTAPPQCGGTCPAGLVCAAGGGACACTVPACDQTFPTCGGTCPGDMVCVSGGGACACQPPTCDQAAAPQCGGTCPPPQVCVSGGGGCSCAPPTCEQTFPTCGGTCPAGLVCTTSGGACACTVPACDQTFPTCGGPCPGDLVCVSGGGACACQPPTCDQAAPPQCGGTCPAPQVCVSGGGSCSCAPPTCDQSFPACDGTCPTGSTCTPGGGTCQCQVQPLDLDGQYLLDLQVTSDTCGLAPAPGSVPALVQEQDQTAATVDLPEGGAGGTCNPQSYVRSGDTLSRTATSTALFGACTLQVQATTTFAFFADGSVNGVEQDTLSAAGGDCSGLSLPCQIALAATGARCTGCFDCTTSTPLGAPRGRPPLLGAVD